MPEPTLTMKFDPRTIKHLGVRLYSTLPPVLAELVANAYDADAEQVHIHLLDDGTNKEIVVSDDGHGMTFQEIDEKFLMIGRDRRHEDQTDVSPGGRKIIGKKGLGKLSFFGIAHEVEISTKKAGKHNTFKLRWDEIQAEEKEYHPTVVINDEDCGDEMGTTVMLREIQRESDFDAEEVANSLSKMFIVDEDFGISIQLNDGDTVPVENERKYNDLDKEVEWSIPNDLAEEWECEVKDKISGHLIATKKPISPRTNMRGITLFSRKKLVNLPEYFSDSTSSHFFSYLTGWLEVDYIDELDEDVISTNRQALNWGHPEMQKLKLCLQRMINSLERDWRRKRADLRAEEAEKRTGMSIGEWRSHIPEEIKDDLDPVIGALLSESELADDDLTSSLKGLQKIIKPYPYFHWRNLHPELKTLAFRYYKDGNYYTAVFEGVKKYINNLKAKSSSTITDRNLIENVFALKNPKMSVTDAFSKPNGDSFEADTVKNITEGHRMLALAMWDAFRDPISHEEVEDLGQSGLYTDRDCLDALALLSHLYYRLDNAVVL
ncbi:MAG: TIGR02391 family protein [Candidatus Moraniibacteriota bacterium]|nr:MAG: TIGR02391 family protein [Candidatus Moranbacteria bacterium]